jgi:beta-lactamase regulating signal transducer with metallopeptidase domain
VVLVGLWASFSAILLSRLALGYLAIRRLKRRAEPAPDAWQTRLKMLAARTNVRRPSRLLVSDEVSAPMALGFFTPAIIIPRSLPRQMSRADFDHIALHELAHLRRYDDWTNLVQRFIEAVFPIQPALFWIGRQLTLEREAACDDWVVSVAGAPKTYAASLTRVAELTLWARGAILASGVAGHPSQLYRRVQRLLDKTRNPAPRISTPTLALALIAVIFLVVGALNAPQVFALADQPGVADAVPADDPQSSPAAQPAGPGDLSRLFVVESGDKLKVEADQANIHVRAWNKDAVLVAVTQSGPNLAELLRHSHIAMNKGGEEVTVRQTIDQGFSVPEGTRIEFTICVPAKFDTFVKDENGNIDLSNLEGKIELTTGNGNIQLEKLKGAVKAVSGNGDVDAAECAASIEATTGNGNLAFRQIDGPVQARNGSGDIDAEACTGKLDAKDGSGNIMLKQLTETSVDAETGSGNISASFDAAPKSAGKLRSGSGDVTLDLPASAAVNLMIATGSGDIHSDLPSDADLGNVGTENLKILKLNGGGASIHIETGSGDVRLKKH